MSITNTGKNSIAEKIGGLSSSGDFTYLHLGSDGTAASTADTQLGSEFTDSGLEPAEATVYTDSADTLKLVKKFTATADKVVRESGIFAAPATPTDIFATVATDSDVTGSKFSVVQADTRKMITRGSDGTIYTVIGDKLFSSSDNGATWNAGTSLFGDACPGATDMLIDSNDDLHVFYADGSNAQGHLMYRRQSSGVWQDAEQIAASDTYGYCNFKALIDSSNIIHLFHYSKGVGIVYKYWNGSWNTGTALSTGNYPDFGAAIDKDENLHLVFRKNTGFLYMKYTGTWSSPVHITNAHPSNKSSFSIMFDSNDDIHVIVFEPWEDFFTYVYQFSGIWQTPIVRNMPSSSVYIGDGSAIIDENDDIYFFWIDFTDPDYAVGNAYYYKYSSGSWDTNPTLIEEFITGTAINQYGQMSVMDARYPANQVTPSDGFMLVYANVDKSDYTAIARTANLKASWDGGGADSVMLGRSSFDDVYLESGDSITITSKITIS